MKRERPQQDYRDPVCGMDISHNTAPAEAEYKGKTYYFCAPLCRDRFLENPSKYVGSDELQKGSTTTNEPSD